MLEKYPMQNQETEGICKIVADMENDIKRNAKDWDGCMVENMRPHILSDICITINDKSLPSIKDCHHSDEKRR